MKRANLLQIIVIIVLIVAIVAYLAYSGLWGAITLFMGLALWSLALALARKIGIEV